MKYIIASHGDYANGLYSAIKKIAGDNSNIFTINAYTDEETLESKVSEIINTRETQNWIIFTDLLGGSVNQYMMKNLMSKEIRVISGINLYLILAIIQLEENNDLDEHIRERINNARGQMCYINSLLDK